MIIQGRETTDKDIAYVREMISSHPSWYRTRLSKELATLWNWRTSNGQLKDIACRSFLLKLEKRGYITLPPRKYFHRKKERKTSFPYVPHKRITIAGELNTLCPIHIKVLKDKEQISLFKCLISLYHYLGFSTTVGENMKYLVFDKQDRALACLLFGSAAWKTLPRDEFIGWNKDKRCANLKFLTNNMRFLILPWVKVPHLASHILGKVTRRISKDWQIRYNHPIYMLETFVEKDRFRGTCYRSANWIYVGETKGRSRNDRYSTLKVPIKDIYLYPLVKRFRELLCHER
ncbi:MAG: DUF4338 domain-containing protein [Candidatus Aerophobetes bacterium]|nr:DUF4338 domain-containing protein [Candidatus Aerophobetes bacterium]